MSLITGDPEQSPRDCSRSRSSSSGKHRRLCRVLIAASSTVASLASLALILWLTLRPSSPRFSLLAATATLDDDASAATIIVDAALIAHNPNAHATALYGQLRASASYAGVPLGAGAPLPALEQPDQGDAVLSALLTSSTSPSWSWRPAPGRRALLRVRIEGQLRWKVASWVSGRHGLTVDCVAAVVPSSAGQQQQQQVSSSSPSQCATQVL
ncbi:hypothetical protein PAHAL_1G000400 [Panicum hallii]|jgi:hypothetical protein|uniref:Late embryogenesis abundant protein LEA-2 subgroup domain-containing protein n=1 Tax=Panicum hallii TaxID=206008 RepID=A0A2S3GKB1_9POAL|nr:NDR1/HIN1-like protein 26 [Panicum hallii]PAN03510.1 hypothetical protein PAHAL_1G000400 [Panicum hallii]